MEQQILTFELSIPSIIFIIAYSFMVYVFFEMVIEETKITKWNYYWHWYIVPIILFIGITLFLLWIFLDIYNKLKTDASPIIYILLILISLVSTYHLTINYHRLINLMINNQQFRDKYPLRKVKK